MYLIVIGKDQVYTDMPDYRNSPDPAYLNERVRGTGGLPTSFGEENLLSLPIDRYDDESIGVHEFCHTIDSTLTSIDPTWTRRRNDAYRRALDKGLWKLSYAASNPAEFWAEVCLSYFDCNRLEALYQAATAKRQWKGAAAIDGPEAHWVEGVPAYFDATGQDAAPNDSPHPITTRELLKAYDPDLFALVQETMAYEGHVDWRYGLKSSRRLR